MTFFIIDVIVKSSVFPRTKRMINRKIFVCLSVTFFSSFSFNAWANWYAEGSAGLNWLKKDDGKMTITQGTGGEVDTLKQDKADTGLIYHIGGGYIFSLPLPQQSFLKKASLGADIHYSPDRRIEGTTYQYGASDLDNYNFKMNLSFYRMMITAREFISLPERYRIEPYLSEGMGVTWNTVKQFTETPKVGVAGGNYEYKQRTWVGAAYQLGLGISYLINRQWDAYAEYDYWFAGKIDGNNKYQSGVISKGAEWDLREQQLSVGIRYRFS